MRSRADAARRNERRPLVRRGGVRLCGTSWAGIRESRADERCASMLRMTQAASSRPKYKMSGKVLLLIGLIAVGAAWFAEESDHERLIVGGLAVIAAAITVFRASVDFLEPTPGPRFMEWLARAELVAALFAFATVVGVLRIV